MFRPARAGGAESGFVGEELEMVLTVVVQVPGSSKDHGREVRSDMA